MEWVTGAAVLLLAILALAVLNACDRSIPRASTASPRAPSWPAPASVSGIGIPARAGKFAFTVLQVTYAKSVGTEPVAETAQGIFTILDVSVRNIGDQPQPLSDMNQYVLDSHGRRYSSAGMADITLNNGAAGYQEINPGNVLRVRLAFDLPPGVQAAVAELHDSAYSRGVKVRLVGIPLAMIARGIDLS